MFFFVWLRKKKKITGTEKWIYIENLKNEGNGYILDSPQYSILSKSYLFCIWYLNMINLWTAGTWFDLVSLFNGISTFMGYLMQRTVKQQLWYYLINSWRGGKGVPKGISSKVNVIMWVQFELTLMPQYNILATTPWGLPFRNWEKLTHFIETLQEKWPMILKHDHVFILQMRFSKQSLKWDRKFFHRWNTQVLKFETIACFTWYYTPCLISSSKNFKEFIEWNSESSFYNEIYNLHGRLYKIIKIQGKYFNDWVIMTDKIVLFFITLYI